ncbi:MAG: DUF4398 domain-containing protein [Zetaproteobacteria bacterium]|nr:MAG: DUF4398 domain-containing protein [Zetaproteobacteria bacterium]
MTEAFRERKIATMRWVAVGLALWMLAACAAKPPVAEMAAARRAVEAAKAMPDGNAEARLRLQSAEAALAEARKALERGDYEAARKAAQRARTEARRAAFLKRMQKK